MRIFSDFTEGSILGLGSARVFASDAQEITMRQALHRFKIATPGKHFYFLECALITASNKTSKEKLIFTFQPHGQMSFPSLPNTSSRHSFQVQKRNFLWSFSFFGQHRCLLFICPVRLINGLLKDIIRFYGLLFFPVFFQDLPWSGIAGWKKPEVFIYQSSAPTSRKACQPSEMRPYSWLKVRPMF